MLISTLAKITKITYDASFNIYQLLKPSFFTSAETILLIFHAITDTTVNLSSEGIGENLSWLIYEASAAPLMRLQKSNVKGVVVTLVRAVQWVQSQCDFPLRRSRSEGDWAGASRLNSLKGLYERINT